ncbi:MAG: hypothetical protein J2P23_13110, partial [Microlunatus sp.]|nr:hypothetical protein [Microlunatus sp.]
FAETARRAVGSSLRLTLDSDSHQTAAYGEVASIDAAATHDPQSGSTSLFLVNRDHQAAGTIEVDLAALPGAAVQSAVLIADQDRHAANTLEQQDRVTLGDLTAYQQDGHQLKIELPPLSWAALTLA